MTDLIAETAAVAARPPSTAAAAAWLAATAAAAESGVRIVELGDLHDLRDVQALFDSIWNPAPDNRPVTIELMRALTKAGNPLTGAYEGTRLVGACVGFFGAPGGTSLHSHVTGVARTAQRRSIGRALKLHQRAWALDRGITRITWTFDPLVRRNAWFNLSRLGATPLEYLPDFYGRMDDTINADDQSDRLLTAWALDSDPVVRAVAGEPVQVDLAGLLAAGAVAVVAPGPDGAPVVSPGATGHPWLVAVPPDVETLRARAPQLAAQWRLAVREALGGALDAGARVHGFAREGWYVVDGVAPAGAPEPGRATP
ncbi:putative GNAT superfamily acetyltransferase [Modestobacter versicolor]|uniref:Putative GNAT superfamily acetyltransferase n=1 Tax=Modestobacter versicolor TaxID=429133 RepID=A0A839YER3_9ACTN|nr:putative GNAT superfamily acetyltransferase [Modestobacter versicolor]